MNPPTWVRTISIIAVIAVFSVLGYRLAPRREVLPPLVEPRMPAKTAPVRVPAVPAADHLPARPVAAAPAGESTPLSPEKAARVEQIKRDYDDVRTKAAAEYSAAGRDFPGGLNGFLRQLTLL